MLNRHALILLATFVFSHCSFADTNSRSSKEEQHIEVSMRMIGHQVLLSLGDSSSRVLPIEKNGDSYRIRFESEFGFNPESLQSTIDSVITATRIASSYVVEFKSCESDLVVHSYEIGISEHSNVLACRERDQPKACYNLLITILKPGISTETTLIETSVSESDSKYALGLGALLIILGIVAIGLVKFILSRKSESKNELDQNIIPIGEYRFNKRKMELSFREERIELTSKECDLLQLLCDSTNNTVERETILKMVWGDDGDYVGRTLDVFISKLRKKLEGDSNVKITNIRGIGYKLVVDS
jgi:DNA-binding winged helix-turn-helix (wHTH) protein